MEWIVDGENELKMKLNFGHDYGASIILGGLGYDLQEMPPFASTIFFELWYDTETDAFEVATLYNDEPITFGHCDTNPCEFFTFKQSIMDSVAQGTVDEACRVESIVEQLAF